MLVLECPDTRLPNTTSLHCDVHLLVEQSGGRREAKSAGGTLFILLYSLPVGGNNAP